MTSVKSILENRTVSSFYLSIGTAMALESLFDPIINVYDESRSIERVDVNKYTHHYFNVYTLIRNIITSVPSIEQDVILKDNKAEDYVANILFDEIEVLEELYSNVKTDVVLFIPNYTKVYKNAIMKEIGPIPSRKDEIYMLSNNVIRILLKRVKSHEVPISVVSNTHLLPNHTDSVLITTHIAMDLLNVNHIHKLYLLESHTGKIKRKLDFNTKYHAIGAHDLSILPFNEPLLYILGDNNFILGESIKVRRTIYELAKLHKWLPNTNRLKIVNDLKTIPEIRQRVNKFVFVY